MSRNGSGTYSLPAGNPVVSGTTISSTWANTTLNNIAAALTDSLAADGQTTATGNLKMGANRITGLADGIADTDAASLGQVNTIVGDYIPVSDIGVTVEAYDATILKSADIGVTVEAYDSHIVKDNVVSDFTKQQYFGNVALTDASTVAWNAETAQVATFTFVSSNRTMGAPTNLVSGAYYGLAIIQNAGSNTLTWDSVFKWTGGTAPTLSTAAGAKDYFVFRSDGTNMYEQGRSLGVS